MGAWETATWESLRSGKKRYGLAQSGLAQNGHEADESLHFVSRHVANVHRLGCDKTAVLSARSASGGFGVYQDHDKWDGRGSIIKMTGACGVTRKGE